MNTSLHNEKFGEILDISMRAALAVAESCHDIEWYGVGCVVTDSLGVIVATGYTGEILDEKGGFRHAEDVALSKVVASGIDLSAGDFLLFSTLEPCSVRASGKTPCVKRIIQSGIRHVIYGAKEPFDPALNVVCNGDQELRDRGIEVTWLRAFEPECLKSVVSKRKVGA